MKMATIKNLERRQQNTQGASPGKNMQEKHSEFIKGFLENSNT